MSQANCSESESEFRVDLSRDERQILSTWSPALFTVRLPLRGRPSWSLEKIKNPPRKKDHRATGRTPKDASWIRKTTAKCLLPRRRKEHNKINSQLALCKIRQIIIQHVLYTTYTLYPSSH